MSYWIRTESGREGCAAVWGLPDAEKRAWMLQVTDEERLAWLSAKLGERVVALAQLPYDASPVLLGEGHALCYSPQQCKGRSSCPQLRACSE